MTTNTRNIIMKTGTKTANFSIKGHEGFERLDDIAGAGDIKIINHDIQILTIHNYHMGETFRFFLLFKGIEESSIDIKYKYKYIEKDLPNSVFYFKDFIQNYSDGKKGDSFIYYSDKLFSPNENDWAEIKNENIKFSNPKKIAFCENNDRYGSFSRKIETYFMNLEMSKNLLLENDIIYQSDNLGNNSNVYNAGAAFLNSNNKSSGWENENSDITISKHDFSISVTDSINGAGGSGVRINAAQQIKIYTDTINGNSDQVPKSSGYRNREGETISIGWHGHSGNSYSMSPSISSFTLSGYKPSDMGNEFISKLDSICKYPIYLNKIDILSKDSPLMFSNVNFISARLSKKLKSIDQSHIFGALGFPLVSGNNKKFAEGISWSGLSGSFGNYTTGSTVARINETTAQRETRSGYGGVGATDGLVFYTGHSHHVGNRNYSLGSSNPSPSFTVNEIPSNCNKILTKLILSQLDFLPIGSIFFSKSNSNYSYTSIDSSLKGLLMPSSSENINNNLNSIISPTYVIKPGTATVNGGSDSYSTDGSTIPSENNTRNSQYGLDRNRRIGHSIDRLSHSHTVSRSSSSQSYTYESKERHFIGEEFYPHVKMFWD